MRYRIYTFLKVWVISLALPMVSIAQSDSSGLRVSLLTCSPGAELYSTFGHSALRIVDSSAGTDIVYNFGVFDFSDPDFYLKFVRGKLLYYLDQQAFPDFMYAYSMEGRQVSEQVLSLSGGRKKQMQAFLFEKIKPENRNYRYDFLFDNCTTRLRDLIFKTIPEANRVVCVPRPGEQTFRKHLHKYLDANGKDWEKLGIDLLLGQRLDRIMTDQESMFLPDYLEIGLDGTTVNGRSVVAEKIILLPRGLQATPIPSPPMTLVWLSMLAGLMLLTSRFKHPILIRMQQFSDFSLFFLSGLLGVVLLLMWTATDHQICTNNMNLLWAIPLNLPAAFLINNDRRWIRGYFKGVAWLSWLLLLCWPALTQSLNLSLIPMVIWMGFASRRIARKHIHGA